MFDVHGFDLAPGVELISGTPVFDEGLRDRGEEFRRLVATQSALNLQKQWLLLSMNPNTGNGGTCYGDSSGPHFAHSIDPNLQVSITITGDAVCKATDLTYGLDTPEARGFLLEFVDIQM